MLQKLPLSASRALASHLPHLHTVTREMNMDSNELQAFGVFKPVGHLVVSFPNAEQADAGRHALQRLGFSDDDIHAYTDQEMMRQIAADLERASPLAGVGQELNLIKAHQALAERGYHWLVVRAENDAKARTAAEALQQAGAERAQLYGRFVIEEMIEHAADLPQVKDSPDAGLDAQTPSGLESERAALRPPKDNTAAD